MSLRNVKPEEVCVLSCEILQIINDSGSQVVDTWAFYADDLKVVARAVNFMQKMVIEKEPEHPVSCQCLQSSHSSF